MTSIITNSAFSLRAFSLTAIASVSTAIIPLLMIFVAFVNIVNNFLKKLFKFVVTFARTHPLREAKRAPFLPSLFNFRRNTNSRPYMRQSPAYMAQSPAYMAQSHAYMAQSHLYMAQSHPYMRQSHAYMAQSYAYMAQSYSYMRHAKNHVTYHNSVI
jgi:hypothetical protein